MRPLYVCAHRSGPCLELSRRLPERLGQWACPLASAELCYGIDPYLLAAIMDQESRGEEALTPPTPAGTGDHGHGRGLMQIDDRSHHSFVNARFSNGGYLWQEPPFNVLYAAWLFRTNLNEARGEIVVAIAGYNCGVTRALQQVEHMTRPLDEVAAIPLLDKKTARGNYVSSVLAKKHKLMAGTDE